MSVARSQNEIPLEEDIPKSGSSSRKHSLIDKDTRTAKTELKREEKRLLNPSPFPPNISDGAAHGRPTGSVDSSVQQWAASLDPHESEKNKLDIVREEDLSGLSAGNS